MIIAATGFERLPEESQCRRGAVSLAPEPARSLTSVAWITDGGEAAFSIVSRGAMSMGDSARATSSRWRKLCFRTSRG